MTETIDAVPLPLPSMDAIGAQRPACPASDAQRRALFFNSSNAFNIQLSPVPAGFFSQTWRAASAPDAATAYYDCDQSAALESQRAATTPLMLARYARIGRGEHLQANFSTSGAIAFVIAGDGKTTCAHPAWSETVHWATGDVLYVPGGSDVVHTAMHENAVLWVVTDEPLLGFGELAPAAPSWRGCVHYPAGEIRRQLALLYATDADPGEGRALIFSNEALEATHNIHPFLTLSLNTLPPGASQSAHRHNSAAITLIVDGEDAHSMVDGRRVPWERWTTMVTPPGAVHSHHNHGAERALFLIVQDGGLHYRARTMGFEKVETSAS